MTTTRAEVIREELVRVVRARPFEPFALTLESGERVILNHPENIAFDPVPGKSVKFYALGDKLVTVGTLDAVSTVATLDPAAV